LMRTLDAGTMGGDSGSWPYLISMFVITLGGVFVVSTLIGVLTSGIEGKLEEVRKGRSFVAEEGHSIILGWSPQVFTIINELITANANQKKACVAVLAEKDKVEMEDEIRARIPDPLTTRIVCRTGSPVDPADLEIVNPYTARSIIILSDESIQDPDANTIKTILALTNAPNRRPEKYHIVAAMKDHKNMDVARMVGKDEVEIILVDELIARVSTQTCRQSGLSVIYTELLDFGGDEIYFKDESGLVGKTFGEALLLYEDSTLMGIEKAGKVQLNPPMDTLIEAGDRVIAVAEDDDTLHLSGLVSIPLDETAICTGTQATPESRPEHTLILGWNKRAHLIIHELDNYVAHGSQVTVVAENDAFELPAFLERLRLGNLVNQRLHFKYGDTTDRQTLDSLDTGSYDHIIVLSYSETLERQEADARTLVTLLHLRDIADKSGQDFAIISEMLDVRNRELAEVTRADDFIVSDKLVSLLLTQISENKLLAPVFEDLFDPEGSELYLKPADLFVELGKPVSFYTVVEAARRAGAVAIGYRNAAEEHNAGCQYGVTVNPDKSKLVTFSKGDKIVVLSEN
jgi:ion channel POLLUX/CASTOR